MHRFLKLAGSVALASLLTSSAQAATATLLYSFPYAYLVNSLKLDSNGNLIAATTDVNGGDKAAGTIVKLSPPQSGNRQWIPVTLAKTAHATALSLVDDALGNYYVISSGPKAASINRILKPASPTGAWVQRVLYADSTGATEAGLVAIAAGSTGRTMFGVEVAGGSHLCSDSHCGAIFKLTPPPAGQTYWTRTNLHEFTGGSDGAHPSSKLYFGQDGSLWGVNENAFFKMSPQAGGGSAWMFATLYTFNGGTDGYEPYGLPIRDANGAFYGTTAEGGNTKCGGAGCGIIYKLRPPAGGRANWVDQVLYRFQPRTENGFVSLTSTLTLGPNGALYGLIDYYTKTANTALELFKLSPPLPGQTAWTYSTVYNWGSTRDAPEAPVCIDRNGALYVSIGESATSRSLIYKITP